MGGGIGEEAVNGGATVPTTSFTVPLPTKQMIILNRSKLSRIHA